MPPCQDAGTSPAGEEAWLGAMLVSRISSSQGAQGVSFGGTFMNSLPCRRTGMSAGGAGVSGGYHSPAAAGSEVLLLIPNRGAASYQPFLFSSTLFPASSWLSQPCGGVSLISFIYSHPFSLSFACAGQGAAFVCQAEPCCAAPRCLLPALPSPGCLHSCSSCWPIGGG